MYVISLYTMWVCVCVLYIMCHQLLLACTLIHCVHNDSLSQHLQLFLCFSFLQQYRIQLVVNIYKHATEITTEDIFISSMPPLKIEFMFF